MGREGLYKYNEGLTPEEQRKGAARIAAVQEKRKAREAAAKLAEELKPSVGNEKKSATFEHVLGMYQEELKKLGVGQIEGHIVDLKELLKDFSERDFSRTDSDFAAKIHGGWNEWGRKDIKALIEKLEGMVKKAEEKKMGEEAMKKLEDFPNQ